MTKLNVLGTIVALATTPGSLLAQVITGRVLEAGSDLPIPSASVTLVAGNRSLLSTESDSAGNFRVAVPRAGWYSLRVERIGYSAASSDTLEVGSGENVEVALRLSVTAVPLEPLLVVERRSRILVASWRSRSVGILAPACWRGRTLGLMVFSLAN